MIKTASTFDSIRSLSDGSIKMSFTTQEIDNETARSIFSNRQQFGWLIFSPKETAKDEEFDELLASTPPSQSKIFSGESKSVQLRKKIFKKYKYELETEKINNIGFEKYYDNFIDRIMFKIDESLT